jgi:hypothetical protein
MVQTLKHWQYVPFLLSFIVRLHLAARIIESQDLLYKENCIKLHRVECTNTAQKVIQQLREEYPPSSVDGDAEI